ncbi:MAG: hypothetical protein RJA69_851 [Pseudomonadota bacterium]
MGLQVYQALIVCLHAQGDVQIGPRHQARGVIGPLAQLETGASEQVAKTGVFPLAWVAEAVEVEMQGVVRWLLGTTFEAVGLHHRIGRTLDATSNAQGTQQVTNQGGLACAQVAAQRQHGVEHRGLLRQPARKRRRRVLLGPHQGAGPGGRLGRAKGGFYNGRMVQNDSDALQQERWRAQWQDWAQQLGFSQIAVAPVDLTDAEPGLLAWLQAQCHGEMDYMQRHGLRRARPAELVPGTLSVITARMDYLPTSVGEDWVERETARLAKPDQAVISLYARGRDYHKVIRARLQQLATRIEQQLGPMGSRVFTDSAPVLEAELAVRSGLGWRGKHTLVLDRQAGSMFFLGEIFVNRALDPTAPVSDHCGSCQACLQACPTQAIVAPYRLDARRCISYLTIEHPGAIPEPLRPLMGNRIYGCDDCQLVCPWNKYAQRATLPDFDQRHPLGTATLLQLWAWDEATFLTATEGSPIRRIGHERWLRNLAVALGNALRGAESTEAMGVRAALTLHVEHPSELVREHVQWALAQ